MVGGKTTVIGSNISSNSENSQSNAVMTLSGGSGKFRIDMAADGSDLGHRLYVGMGTNITSDTVNNRSCAIIGGTDCHRRSKASFKAQLQ